MIKRILVIFIILSGGFLLSGCAENLLTKSVDNKARVSEAPEVVAAIPKEPHNITLMLPLNGELAATGLAIKNGFLAAYYNAHGKKPDANINVVNTASGNIVNLYNQAVAGGAEVIIGPLTKPEVESLAKIGSLPVPVVALNTLDNYAQYNVPGLYQFGLLPQDEAAQTAIKMLQDGYTKVAIIAPASSWGEKIVNAFKEKYEANGGNVVVISDYASADLTSQICHLLAIDPNQMCVRRTSKNKHEHTPLETARRQDIEAFFLVATPTRARQIVPLLRFYYAGDLPVYSISSIYRGTPAPDLDQDINGVFFCDMPWIIKPTSLAPELQTIRAQIMASAKDTFANYNKLYALGADAYLLAFSLHSFLSSPQTGLNGATGILLLDNYHHIYRELDWAQIRDGVPASL